MRCDEIRLQLDAYVEGELAGPERVAVTSHLATCKACRRLADALEQMAGLLYQLPREPVPEGLATRIVASVEAQRRMAPGWTVRTILVAAATNMAALMAVWLAFETALAAQVGGVVDFASLVASQPQMLVAYPQDAVSALLESLPATELVLTLGMILVVLLLLNQLLTSLDTRRVGEQLANGAR